jgi:hypothetical protein
LLVAENPANILTPQRAVDSAPKARNNKAQANEAVKKSRNEQKHLARRRKGAEAEQKTKGLFIANLCVSASLREDEYFFTSYSAWALLFCPLWGSLAHPLPVEREKDV